MKPRKSWKREKQILLPPSQFHSISFFFLVFVALFMGVCVRGRVLEGVVV